jgi:hypothetical protein
MLYSFHSWSRRESGLNGIVAAVCPRRPCLSRRNERAVVRAGLQLSLRLPPSHKRYGARRWPNEQANRGMNLHRNSGTTKAVLDEKEKTGRWTNSFRLTAHSNGRRVYTYQAGCL